MKQVRREEVEQFLYHEAWLLDRRLFHEWCDLFTEDGLYWVLNWCEEEDPAHYGVIAYERGEEIRARAERLLHPLAFIQEPIPRSRRLITNVRIVGEADGGIVVTSNFAVFVSRGSQQEQYAGSYEHNLIEENGRYFMRYKKVFVINNDQPVRVIPTIL